MADERPQMKLAAQSMNERGGALEPTPGMAVITCGASELIPTVQYGNCLVGPITVSRMVPDDESLPAEIKRTQEMCEAAVAEERQTIHALSRGVRGAA